MKGCVLKVKYYLKNEFRRALFGKNACISFVITLIILMVSFINYIGFPNSGIELAIYSWQNPNFDAIDIFIYTMSEGILLLFPILAVIIFSDSYLVEKQSGFTKFVYTRISIKKYAFIKVVVNSICSGLVVGGASLLMLIVSVCKFGINEPERGSYTSSRHGSFSYLLDSSDTRLLYAIVILILLIISCMVIATLCLGISAWIKNRYVVLIIPFFYNIICGTIIERTGINWIFDFYLSRALILGYGKTINNLLIYLLLIFVVGAALFYGGVIIKNEKDL